MECNEDEILWAKKYYQERTGPPAPCYLLCESQSDVIIDAVTQLRKKWQINSVLDFGCGTGRTLWYLRQKFPDIAIAGIDISPVMIAAGAHFGLDLQVGDEDLIPEIESFDLVYTVSVLDHIPQPSPIIAKLKKASKRLVLFVEPKLEKEGYASEQGIKSSSPFTYSWDYDRLISENGLTLLSCESKPLGEPGMSPYYFLWTCCKEGRCTT